MDSEAAVRLIGREAGYELAFGLSGIAGTVHQDRISDETSRVVRGIIDSRNREYPEYLSTRNLYDQFIDAMMTTYNEAYPRISKPVPGRPLQPT